MTVVMRRLSFAEMGLLFWMMVMMSSSRNGPFPRTATAFVTSHSRRPGPGWWLSPKSPPVLLLQPPPPHHDDSSSCLFASTTTTTTTTAAAASKDSSIISPTLAAQAVLQAWKEDADYRALYNDNDDNDDNNNDNTNNNRLDIPPGLYSLIRAIQESRTPLGLGNGVPFVLRDDDLPTTSTSSYSCSFSNLFTLQDLEEAVAQDFLDAARGSTNHRKGWKISPVSIPRGDSFEEARMTFEDVQVALKEGTVIFNAAGAHIPQLAGPCLAVTEAAALPNAVNVYITAPGKPTSAPPHTDQQDVVVIQSTGCKDWKVYAPTDPKDKPGSNVFARGKGEDDLPLYSLQQGGTLLLDTTLFPGDVLVIPAGFPHTTATTTTTTTTTAQDDDDDDATSIHLTFNLDTHVWDLDYVNARRLALQRANVKDTALNTDTTTVYTGPINTLPTRLHQDLLASFPMGFLDDEEDETTTTTTMVETVTAELMRISQAVDEDTFAQVPTTIWKETVERLRQHGRTLLEIHRDMYLAAMEEGRTRQAEAAMTAHLSSSSDNNKNNKNNSNKRRTMSPERMQRLSLFRVPRYYDQITAAKNQLVEWSLSSSGDGSAATSRRSEDDGDDATSTAPAPAAHVLPEDWAWTLPLQVGDSVEADLGGAFFPATITRIRSTSMNADNKCYDVQFFDGDQEKGLDRSQIKLLQPPPKNNVDEDDQDVDTSNMTPKQLKRWKKQQEKKQKKNLQR